MKIRQCRSALLLALFSVCCLTSCANNSVKPNSNTDTLATASSSQAFSSLVTKGDEALSRRSYDDAQVQYALALKQQPEDIGLLYKLAVVHYETDSFDVASDLLVAILNKEAQHIGAHEMLGLIALKNEDITQAEERLSAALAIDATRWRSQNAMGIVKDMQSQHALAQQHFLQALYNTPDKAQTQNNLGYSYYLDGSYRQAENHFRKATQLDANYEKAWANLGLVYVRLRQYEDARFAFGKVVDDHVAANNLGYLSMLQGDVEMANQELARAVLIAPTYYPKANENINSLNARKSSPEFFKPPAAKIAAIATPVVSSEQVLAPVIIQESAYKAPETTTPIVSPVVSDNPTVKRAMAVKKKKPSTVGLSNELSKLYLEFLGHQLRDGKDSLYYPLLSFQASHQLEPTGQLDRASADALRAATVQRVKTVLQSLSYEVGSDDSSLDVKTIASLKSFQTANSLPISSAMDKNTIAALKSYLNGDTPVSNTISQ